MSYVNINRTYYETNYTPTQNTRVECKVSFVSSTTEYEPWIFGRRYSSQSHLSRYSFNCFFFNVSNNLAYHIGGTYNDYGGEYAVGVPYIISLSPTQWTYNGNSTSITSNYQQYSSTGFPIGAAYTVNQNSYQYCLDFDLYYFKIYEGDTLVRNYVPRLYNGVACLYDTIGETYLQPNDSSKATYVSSLDVSPSSKSFKASGGTQTITIDADDAWSACTESDWFSLSSYSGESGTSTVTLSCPNYTGTVKQTGIITFTSGDEVVEFSVKQNGVSSASDTIRIGENAIAGLYLGSSQISAAYIGEQEFWANSFSGIRLAPKQKVFKATGGTAEYKVKSSEDWTISSNADWLSFSSNSGQSGVTIITASCTNYTSETENRSATISASTNSMTVTGSVVQQKVSSIQVPDNWHFLLVFKTTEANERVILKGTYSQQSFTYYDGETGEEIANGQSAYTFTNAGYHPVFYYKTGGNNSPGYEMFYNTEIKVYGCYFNSETMTGQALPRQMFHNESLFNNNIGTYLYIPEGMVMGNSALFVMGYFLYLKTLVIPSTMITHYSGNEDWVFCGMANCNKVYRFSDSNQMYITEFGYDNVADIGRLVTGDKYQYYPNGKQPYTGTAIRKFTGVEMEAGATMDSMGLSRTVEEWWNEVAASF